MSVVTLREYRRRGIARRIMRLMLAWLSEAQIQKAALHASDMGHQLYVDLGFKDSNEMILFQS